MTWTMIPLNGAKSAAAPGWFTFDTITLTVYATVVAQFGGWATPRYNTLLRACGVTPIKGSRPADSVLLGSEGLIMPRNRKLASWLRQEAYLKYMGVAGLASAWAMDRRRPI